MKKIKTFEMFAGYGGASFALKKAGIPFKCVGYSEIDKYAVQCYEQNHNPKRLIEFENSHSWSINFGDATKIDPGSIPDFDLLTGGFPCQPFSVAGKGLGELDTRGTYVYDIIRIAEVKKPKYMLLENVKGLTNKNHKATFDKILSELERIGYNVTYKILNSKEHGIPQKRERIFFFCFRRDITDGGLFADFKVNKDYICFDFQGKEKLNIFLKDVLEDEVDEKYYLSDKQIKALFLNSKNRRGRLPYINSKIAHCITAGDYSKVVFHNQEIIKKTSSSGEYRYRRLTPKECFRLMGFLDDKINLYGLSNTQRYKLAGNGWDINLVSKILKEMIKQ